MPAPPVPASAPGTYEYAPTPAPRAEPYQRADERPDEPAGAVAGSGRGRRFRRRRAPRRAPAEATETGLGVFALHGPADPFPTGADPYMRPD
ncbi:MAG: hypothetical protein ACYC3U_00260, partial [Georgenia sp.]